MSFGAEFAYALGTVIAPYCEAVVQQRSSAQMATFVQNLRPEETTQGTNDPQMQQQLLYEHGDRLLREHIQATGAHPQQPVPQQNVSPQNVPPQQVVPQQHVPQNETGQGRDRNPEPKAEAKSPPVRETVEPAPSVPEAQVDPPASKGHARKVAKYRTPAGTLEVFVRFVPHGMDTGEPEVLPGQQGSGSGQPPAGGAPRSPLPQPPKMSAPPPPPPPPEDAPPAPVMESRPKVPLPKAPPKAPAKSRPQPKGTEIERLPKLVSVKFVVRCLLTRQETKPDAMRPVLGVFPIIQPALMFGVMWLLWCIP